MSSIRSSLRLSIDLNIHAITCPGERLVCRFPLYLKVCILNHQKKTAPQRPTFPIYVNETLLYKKSFPTCRTLTELCMELDDEHVHFELVQVVDEFGCEVILAEYESTLRQFIFPCDRLITYSGYGQRSILMNRTVHHLGIAPRLEFSTKSVISESLSPVIDYINDISKPDDPYYDVDVIKRKSGCSQCPVHATKGMSKCPRHPYICKHEHGNQSNSWHAHNNLKSEEELMIPCRCGKCQSHRDLHKIRKHLTTVAGTEARKPPFVVRKVPDTIPSSCPHCVLESSREKLRGGQRTRSEVHISEHIKSYDQARVDNALRDLASEDSHGPDDYPHSDATCTICRLYRKYMEKSYTHHTHNMNMRDQPSTVEYRARSSPDKLHHSRHRCHDRHDAVNSRLRDLYSHLYNSYRLTSSKHPSA